VLEIAKTASSLAVLLDGNPILAHSLKAPCASIGAGALEIEMRHGMYEIKRDSLLWKKEMRDVHVLVEGKGRIELEFHGLLRLSIIEEQGCARIIPTPKTPEPVSWFSFYLPLSPGEAVMGAGEQFSYADLRGEKLPLWVSEPGVGRGPNYVKLLADIHSGRGGSRTHTYFPQPSFVSSDGTWVFISTTAFSRLDFSRRGECGIEVYAVPEYICIGKAQGEAGAVSMLGRRLGRQPPLPEYFYHGLVLGVQGGRDTVSAKLGIARAAGIPVVALWCQDWQGIRMTPYGKQLFWNWAYDPSLYPELPRFIDSLHNQGIRFMGYNNPFLSTDAPLYAEGARNGYFVKARDGRPYETYTTTFAVSPVDLFNPDARAWFKSIIKENMIGIGLDGWMADFGEYLPPDGVLAGGVDSYRAHNRYPVEWVMANAEAVREAVPIQNANSLGGDRPITFFCRSGFANSSSSAPLFWAGDQAVNFMRDFGMPAAFVAGLSSAMSGVGYWHFDIGGFFSFAWIRRSRELLMRSCEWSAFTQVMRTHEGINPSVNAQFDSDKEMLRHFARMTRVHAALAPYHAWLSRRYQNEGIPPIEPVILRAKGAGRSSARIVSSGGAVVLPDEYCYGPDLLVAPVMKRGARSRRVALPEGPWVDFWTRKEAKPGANLVPAPIGYPPVFYRKDSQFGGIFARASTVADDSGNAS